MNITRFIESTFSSLKLRNYRLYFIGQAVSVSGTFMQAVAQAWLVLQLTNSGFMLGLVAALQFLPMLLFGPFGGVVADRFDKRTILLVTQTMFGIQALVLGMLVLTGAVQVWMVAVLALLYGIINIVDNPVRQTFVPELVGDMNLRNAVTLYTSLVNLGRVAGPVLAAVLIAQTSIGVCFLLNGLSYIAIILLLIAIDPKTLHKTERVNRLRGQLREGVRYIRNTPVLLSTLLMMGVIGTFTYEFQVSLPLLAQGTFHGDAGTYAWLMSMFGIGSVAGGMVFAGQKNSSTKLLVYSAFFFGLATFLSAFMPILEMAVVGIFIAGFFSILFLSLGNTILQLESVPAMRGRVMAYWSVAFLGSTAIGGPVIGWVSQTMNPRWGLGAGGAAGIIAAVVGYFAIADVSGSPKNREASAARLAAEEGERNR